MSRSFADPRDTCRHETVAIKLREAAEATVAASAVLVAESHRLSLQCAAIAWDHADLTSEWAARRARSQVSARVHTLGLRAPTG